MWCYILVYVIYLTNWFNLTTYLHFGNQGFCDQTEFVKVKMFKVAIENDKNIIQ